MSDNDYISLNAMLNLRGADGKLQFDKDKEAARQYFLQHVNKKTQFFHTLQEKIDYLIDEGYYDPEVFNQYDFQVVKETFQRAYSYKYRFPSFVSALKFYNQYAMKDTAGEVYLERYEDRIAVVALTYGEGDPEFVNALVDEMMTNRYQPATPTFLNAGKLRAGSASSCYLLDVDDNMESISRSITNALQLSKRGGGVSLNLTDIRETGAPIKDIENQSSGIIPVMKLLEDSFSYANQLGARQGAGAVYLHAHHPDIMKFLDTKRENADEKVRIKTLSIGVILPDVTFQLAKENKDMYLFSPYDVRKVYGKPLSEVDVTSEYSNMVDNQDIRKSKVSARKLFTTIAELNFESGYPYLMFVDTANRANPVDGHVRMSNLCSEILQSQSKSTFTEEGYYDQVGDDISCNLGSMNVAKVLDGGDIGKTVDTAIRMLSKVAVNLDVKCTPSIDQRNQATRAVGLGQMNLAGFLGREHIMYGSSEALEFVSAYMATVNYHSIKASCALARETGDLFRGFEKSTYADGSYFDLYRDNDFAPKSDRIKGLFTKYGVHVPNLADWEALAADVQEHGLFNQYRQAVAPTGSISYVNFATSSMLPTTARIEVRKEAMVGRVYYPTPEMTDDNMEFFPDAYELGPDAIIDTYAAATPHVDQGMSMTLFMNSTATTRDVNRAQIRAFAKGVKTIYYLRIRQKALEGTEVGCVSCEV